MMPSYRELMMPMTDDMINDAYVMYSHRSFDTLTKTCYVTARNTPELERVNSCHEKVVSYL